MTAELFTSMLHRLSKGDISDEHGADGQKRIYVALQ